MINRMKCEYIIQARINKSNLDQLIKNVDPINDKMSVEISNIGIITKFN